jgi:thioesterase domain-containing protein
MSAGLRREDRRLILAEVLHQPGRCGRASPLVHFGGEGEAPVVLLPCTGAHADALKGDRPVYGLPQGRVPTDPSAGYVESVASWYVECLREAGLVSPYRIVGYCFGGIVAFEMAQQLRAAGEAVRYLQIIEAPAPGRRYGQLLSRQLWADRLTRLLRHSTSTGEVQPGTDPEQTGSAGGRQAGPVSRPGVLSSSKQAALAYEPVPWPGDLDLVFAEKTRVRDVLSPFGGWKGLARGRIRRSKAPGGHVSIFERAGFLPELAERLRQSES